MRSANTRYRSSLAARDSAMPAGLLMQIEPVHHPLPAREDRTIVVPGIGHRRLRQQTIADRARLPPPRCIENGQIDPATNSPVSGCMTSQGGLLNTASKPLSCKTSSPVDNVLPA